MILTALIASAALAAAPVPGDETKPVTIILDQRDQCGIGRVAYDQRAQSERRAKQLKRDLEAQGRTVRIVKLHPGTPLSGAPGPLVSNPAC